MRIEKTSKGFCNNFTRLTSSWELLWIHWAKFSLATAQICVRYRHIDLHSHNGIEWKLWNNYLRAGNYFSIGVVLLFRSVSDKQVQGALRYHAASLLHSIQQPVVIRLHLNELSLVVFSNVSSIPGNFNIQI